MSPTLRSHRYGKSRVRLTHLDRSSEPHRLCVASVDVALDGDFERCYTEGDNANVVATDSMKNTVYVLARERGVDSIDSFAAALARHFVDSYEQVAAARIEIEEELWSPIALDGDAAPDAFERTASEVATAWAAYDGAELAQGSGLDRLKVIKTANSGFSTYHRDRFATLPDTDDRLFATSVRAGWRLTPERLAGDPDFGSLRREVRRLLVGTFAAHHSLSVQQTLHAMGEAVLAALPEVEEISLRLPNQHHLLVDLARFGLDNDNRVFVATDEPFGLIEATLGR